MGAELPHKKVKLVIPALYSDELKLSKAGEKLGEIYGETDFRSESFPFAYTDYYNKEMGNSIKRVFFSYKRLIDIPDLVQIKKVTNIIELELSESGLRAVNLDP